MARGLRIAQVGLGPIGQGIARMALGTPGLQVVGATDPSPALAGKDLGMALGLERRLRLRVEGDPERFVRKVKADVAVVCTSSSLRAVKAQIQALVRRGLHVVTTCEELAFPTAAHQGPFRELDRLARARRVSVLGTGVNPGYAMDALALALTAPCHSVRRVSVTRVVDAASRRLPLQRKVGAGLNLNQFRRAATEGTVKHVGLPESVAMIASALGWKLDRVDETLEPAIAPRDLDTEVLRVPAGAVAGIRQSARGYRDGEPVINLDLQMYVGAEAPRDHVLIDGVPPIDMTIQGGVAGDVATAAIVLNALPKMLAAGPGLRTMKDIPLVHALNPVELRDLAGRRKR